MGTAKHHSILRKTDKGRHAAGCNVRKALPLAFARAAEEFIGMPLDVRSVNKSTVQQNGLAKILPNVGLFSLLEAKEGATGAAVFDFAFVSGITEHLTIGAVQDRPFGDDRQLSAVDAALIAPVFDKLMQSVDKSFPDNEMPDWSVGHHFGSMIEDARTLVLSIFGEQFVVYDVDVALGDVRKQARLTLVLPRNAEPQRDISESQKELAAAFQENVLSSPANVCAVLSRFEMPYDGLNKLELGSMIEIHPSALKDLRLEMPNGELLARAQLGQINGQRAARVALPEELQRRDAQIATTSVKSKNGKDKIHLLGEAEDTQVEVTDQQAHQQDEQPLIPNPPRETDDFEDLDALIDLPES